MYGWGKWEVSIRRSSFQIGGSIIIFRASNERREFEILNFNEKGEGIATTIRSGQIETAPTMQFADEMELRQIIAAFTEAGKEFGVRAPDESHNAGKLEATEKHLEDMRKIVFAPEINIEVKGKRP